MNEKQKEVLLELLKKQVAEFLKTQNLGYRETATIHQTETDVLVGFLVGVYIFNDRNLIDTIRIEIE